MWKREYTRRCYASEKHRGGRDGGGDTARYCVYLDQNKWVDLARAPVSAIDREAGFAEVYEALKVAAQIWSRLVPAQLSALFRDPRAS